MSELLDERVRPGWLVVQENNRHPKLRVRPRLGAAPPRVVGGYGGWELVRRPRRRAITEWTGSDPIRIEVSFLFNEFGGEPPNTVEPQCRELEKMAGLRDEGVYPPVLWWEANAPHDHAVRPDLEWVIENLEWEDEIRNNYGNRVRASGRITFLQFVREEYSKLSPSARNRNNHNRNDDGDRRPHAKHKVHIVTSGETLRGIAKRELGNAKYWKLIAKLNKIRDPNKIHVGQKLKLP